MATKQSKFIVVEGLEGAGKTTAIDFIGQLLTKAGCEFITVHEPGTSELGGKIREILKNPQNDLLPETELLLITANRIELIEKFIKPALADNKWVLGDRHFLSTLAYQGGGRKLDQELIIKLHQYIVKNFTPDLYLYFDIEPQIGLARAKLRGKFDRFEREDVSFFERAREVFVRSINSYKNVELIDASQQLLVVHDNIKKILYRHYPELCKE